MYKKGSMELSVNSIVILVVAITMLGLILGLVNSKFGDLDKKLVDKEPEAPTATSNDPITMSRQELVVSAGETLGMKFQIYNKLNAVMPTIVPGVTCNAGGPTIIITSNKKDITQGSVATYESIVKVGSVAKGKYLCILAAHTAAGNVAGAKYGTAPDTVEKEIIVTVQ